MEGWRFSPGLTFVLPGVYKEVLTGTARAVTEVADVSGILNALNLVRETEAEAEQLVSAARSEASDLLRRAGEEGRRAYDTRLLSAGREGRALIEAARSEASATSRALEQENRGALEELDRRAADHLPDAVTRLIELFLQAHGPRVRE
jgi:vacuolar-type H+-ATPase subunit H